MSADELWMLFRGAALVLWVIVALSSLATMISNRVRSVRADRELADAQARMEAAQQRMEIAQQRMEAAEAKQKKARAATLPMMILARRDGDGEVH